MANAAAFDRFFLQATGHTPYDYQRELARSTPGVLHVPTGCGKTQAMIVSWLFSRLVTRRAPKRLVYALPQHSLVEQTRDVARRMRRRLELADEDLPIHVVMSGEAASDWREHPEGNQILVGTIDMLLSRALNRGFGENRFVWPVSFGLLNADCRWVFDDIQLMGPARTTSAQLDGLRRSFGTALPCETLWTSAAVHRDALLTIDHPELGDVLTLSPSDRRGPLRAQLRAQKHLSRVDLSPFDRRDHVDRIAELVAQNHKTGSRSIVVANTVRRARELAHVLEKHSWGGRRPSLVLLHSRYRPPERESRVRAALADVPRAGTIVVATPVIEAGLDVSARLLATETAPFSSIVQRLGRCNRYGELEEGSILWLDRGECEGRAANKDAFPYLPDNLNHCRHALMELDGMSASPETLAKLDVSENREEPDILRRRDLLDLFDNGPDLSGMNVDVSPFITNVEDRTVPVFFRDVQADEAAGIPPAHQRSPSAEEVVEVPIADVRKNLDKVFIRRAARRAWLFDHVGGEWVRAHARDLVPGRPLMLDAAEGGYDEAGWNPSSAVAVTCVPLPGGPARDHGGREEAIGSDPDSTSAAWVGLTEHLATARDCAASLAEHLDGGDVTADMWAAVIAAAAVHDIGKAHPVFQRALRARTNSNEHSDDTETFVARGPHHKGYDRPHFRHELAGALALRTRGDGSDSPITAHSDLVQYLVAAHHGRVRLSIRSAPDERPADRDLGATRFALGVQEGDELPAVDTPLGPFSATRLDLACIDLGGNRSWSAAMLALRDDSTLGPFRLAFLEALVRIADWRAGA